MVIDVETGPGQAFHVAIILGSQSDIGRMAPAMETLERLGVPYEVTIASAHRTPERVAGWVAGQESTGAAVFIAAAGMAAHLAGAVAARTTSPVIGVPLSGSAVGGLDALLSTVQMPPGVPVATVGLDAAQNAALLAAQVLALSDPALRQRLVQFRQEKAEAVESAAGKLSRDGWRSFLPEGDQKMSPKHDGGGVSRG